MRGGVHTGRLDGLSEPDIISSIVHKYCNSSVTSSQLTDNEGKHHQPPSISSVVPALLKKKHEEDVIPFPREIEFPTTVDDSLDRGTVDTLSMGSNEIAVACGVIFRAYGFLDAFRISNDKFAAFATNVANYYRSNPFHNFQHAFQVLLSMHGMIRSECRKFFSGVEIFAMLVAALCHDIDHPGNTNDFELKTLSPMALTHNDDAVLERHHCRVTFIILNHKSAKILQHLDEARYKRVRQLIIYCILATDMAKHFEKCKALENLTRRQLTEKRNLLMGILIHAADLSFHTLPFTEANDWGNRLLDEFQTQAKAESEQGVSTDVFMQDLENRKKRLIVQLNSINYVARPIWLPLSSLCHQLRSCADELEKNFEILQTQLKECRLAEQRPKEQVFTATSNFADVSSVPTSEMASTRHYSAVPGLSSHKHSMASAASQGDGMTSTGSNTTASLAGAQHGHLHHHGSTSGTRQR